MPNIRYCTMTIVYKGIEHIFNELSRFFNVSGENIINSIDYIILEYNDSIIKIDLNFQTDNTIKFNYYSYGYFPDIFPKSIIKKQNFTSGYFLTIIESDLINQEYVNKCLKILFDNYPHEKINNEPSFYLCAYTNFYEKVSSVITKLKYFCLNSSRYVIAFDTNELDFEDVKNIIKKIFIK